MTPQEYVSLRKRNKSGTFASGSVRVIDKAYIESRIEVTEDGCWVWQRAKNKDGYAIALYKKGNSVLHIKMHRKSFELYNGSIPEGLVIDHLCENPPCVNPDHLEAVSSVENIKRSEYFHRTHCKRGHEKNEGNTYTRPNGYKYCIPCARLTFKEWYRSKSHAS